MKRFLSIILTILLFTACQPTPNQDIVFNKAEGQMETIISQTSPLPAYETIVSEMTDAEQRIDSVSTLRKLLNAPAHIQDTFSGNVFGGSLVVKIDADTSIPNVSKVPVDEIAIRVFTSVEIEQLIKQLLGEGPYYSFNAERYRKEFFASQMQRISLHIDAFQNKIYGESCNHYSELINQEEENMVNFFSLQQDMSEPNPMQPWYGSFSDISIDLANADNDRFFYIGGTLVFEKHPMSPIDSTNNYQILINSTSDYLNSIGNAASAKYFSSEHIDENNRILYKSERGIDEDVLETVFLPVYHGIPLYDYSTCYGSDTAKDAAGANMSYTPTYMQERILVNFSSGEIAHLQWDSPTQLIATVNDNVVLLPFDEILRVFRSQILYHYYLDPAKPNETDPIFHMVITDIRFSYSRVKRQNADTYYLIPVWDFMGYGYDDDIPNTALLQERYAHQSFLTINAIDGSIIDRNLGY